MLDAYETFGFRHNDLHAKNVLIKPSKLGKIKYSTGIEIEVEGFRIYLMDLENSQFNAPVEKFWADLEEFFSSLVLKYEIVSRESVRELREYVVKCGDINANSREALKLLPLIEKLKLA